MASLRVSVTFRSRQRSDSGDALVVDEQSSFLTMQLAELRSTWPKASTWSSARHGSTVRRLLTLSATIAARTNHKQRGPYAITVSAFKTKIVSRSVYDNLSF